MELMVLSVPQNLVSTTVFGRRPERRDTAMFLKRGKVESKLDLYPNLWRVLVG
jgi:hypothetical protein